MNQRDLDNRANQKNPNHKSYWKSRGYPGRPDNWRVLIDDNEYDSDDTDSRNNRANQKNPNHIYYWKSRGYSRRPPNWREEIDSDEYESEDEMESSVSSSNQGTIATNDSSSSLATWIGGGILAGFGLLAVAGAIGEALSDDSRERRRRNQRNEEN